MTPHIPASLAGRVRRLAMPGLLITSLILAAAVTLATVDVVDGDLSSEGGYTWSLGLWYLPIIILSAWFLRRPRRSIQWPAFWTTLSILLVIGFALDYLFAQSFLAFPANTATLLPPAPALGDSIPTEEYLFYVGGFLFILLTYIWCDEDFLRLYNVPDYAAEWKASGRSRVIEFDPMALALGGVAIAAAWAYKLTLATGDYHGGFPGYFAYLVIVGTAPAAGLFRSTRHFINWRAFTVTFLAVVLISILWEATLAARLEWWVYQPHEMIGIVVRPWYDLPLEAIIVWLAATFTSVITYEAVKVWQAGGSQMPEFLPEAVKTSVRRRYHNLQ